MINLQCITESGQEINLDIIEFAIHSTLTCFEKQDLDLTLRLTNNDEIQFLNRKYRNMDDVTDVLSFNQDFVDPATGRYYLGDIIISIEKAEQQAGLNQISLDEECAFLAIHGTLHLLGFDHGSAESKQEMWQHQDAIYLKVRQNYKEKKQ